MTTAISDSGVQFADGSILPTASQVTVPAMNLSMTVSAASATATLTASVVIARTALAGSVFPLINFSKTINLATTGAGGMDTGSAPTSGFVALYAIYNPTTQTAALLATNATSAAAANIYGGANMPSGYTASALVSVWPTNGSGQFVVGNQVDRRVSIVPVQILSTTTPQGSPTIVNFTSGAPKNARSIRGLMQSGCANNSSTVVAFSVGADTNMVGAQGNNIGLTSVSGYQYQTPFDLDLATAQTIYYTLTITTGSLGTSTINISSYGF
jgi:hypothetical protein